MLSKLPVTDGFWPMIPRRPSGKYAHVVMVRETESYSLFQTDGELNVARVRMGLRPPYAAPTTRIIMFKRKQTTPERLTGREMLRRYEIVQRLKEEKEGYIQVDDCLYNEGTACTACPDCVLYGFAAGNEMSEKSKVYADTCFSITPYDLSHETFSFNAPYEAGNMSQQGQVKEHFGEQDHVLPQVFFPAIETLRDPTELGFIYWLGNILRTATYGAQGTRTGRMENHIVALVFGNSEIFSNLRLTQALYDELATQKVLDENPLPREAVLPAARAAAEVLLASEPGSFTLVAGDDLAALLTELRDLLAEEDRLRETLWQLAQQTSTYAKQWIQRQQKPDNKSGEDNKED